MSILKEFIKLDMEGPQIAVGVIGDAMIDEYFTVQVKKISPEFPIPVMHSETDIPHQCPGGAANVAYQFKNFNAQAELLIAPAHGSRLGDDRLCIGTRAADQETRRRGEKLNESAKPRAVAKRRKLT